MSDSAVRPISDAEWQDLMRQLRDQPKAQPRPFFYSRVRSRLAGPAPAENPVLPGWLRRPAYAVLLGALVLALNGDDAALSSATPAPPHAASPNRSAR